MIQQTPYQKPTFILNRTKVPGFVQTKSLVQAIQVLYAAYLIPKCLVVALLNRTNIDYVLLDNYEKERESEQ